MSDRLSELNGCGELSKLSELDRALLDCVQRGIPLEPCPYAVVAQAVSSEARTAGPSEGVSEAQVIERLRALLEARVLRRIGPVFDSRALGYTGTLCGAEVRPDALETVADVVGSYPGVTHSYEREDDFNLWFTLLASNRESVTTIVNAIARHDGVERLIELPIERQFKIDVRFRLSKAAATPAAMPSGTATPAAMPSGTATPAGPTPGGESPDRAASSGMPSIDRAAPAARDRAIIRVLQDGLPLEPRPFERLAERCSAAGVAIGADELLAKLERYRAVGYLRRVGGAVAHRRAGIRGNGMVVWRVPERRSDELGARVAEFGAVTHCYRRRPAEGWPYNLYAMVHAPTRAECLERVAEIDAAIGGHPHRVLFSRREFKKSSMRYFCEERVKSNGRE